MATPRWPSLLDLGRYYGPLRVSETLVTLQINTPATLCEVNHQRIYLALCASQANTVNVSTKGNVTITSGRIINPNTPVWELWWDQYGPLVGQGFSGISNVMTNVTVFEVIQEYDLPDAKVTNVGNIVDASNESYLSDDFVRQFYTDIGSKYAPPGNSVQPTSGERLRDQLSRRSGPWWRYTDTGGESAAPPYG